MKFMNRYLSDGLFNLNFDFQTPSTASTTVSFTTTAAALSIGPGNTTFYNNTLDSNFALSSMVINNDTTISSVP